MDELRCNSIEHHPGRDRDCVAASGRLSRQPGRDRPERASREAPLGQPGPLDPITIPRFVNRLTIPRVHAPTVANDHHPAMEHSFSSQRS
jgi:hypothetical protein